MRVNSWNEWDPLKAIVVGTAYGAIYDVAEPGHRPKVRGSKNKKFPTGKKPQHVIDAANVELDGLSNLLKRQGVHVFRPASFRFDAWIQTPMFMSPGHYCAVCPRDVMLTVGNEIIEATMSRRGRYFEFYAYRKIAKDFWNADKDSIWSAAPKPTMRDEMYREDFWDKPLEQRFAEMHNSEFCISQEEIIFDAADCSRFGEDVFVQESMTTNRKGIEWLKRHLHARGIRVHAVHFPLDLFPSHIDCTFVPLREGLILTNPDRPIREGEEEIFLRNGWRFIEAPASSSTNDEMPAHCQSSKWLSMNVLSISPKKVICEEREVELHALLIDEGFEVFPIPFRNVYEFGGSLHCATWDLHREGGRENYFPQQVR